MPAILADGRKFAPYVELGGMRLRHVLVAGGLVLRLAVPASAAPGAGPVGHLSVSAAHTASTTLRLLAPTKLNGFDYAFGLPKRVVDRKGAYGGLLIYKGRTPLFGLIGDRDVAAPLIFGDPEAKLKPGLYTLVVVGDKHVSIDLPVPGSRFSYETTARDGAHVTRKSIDPAVEPGISQVAHGAIPVTYPQGGTLALALSVRQNSSQASATSVCLAQDTDPCSNANEVEGLTFTSAHPGVGSGWTVAEAFAYPGDIPAGHYDAVGDDADVALGTTPRLVAYVFR
jgi:hypothetical protein